MRSGRIPKHDDAEMLGAGAELFLISLIPAFRLPENPVAIGIFMEVVVEWDAPRVDIFVVVVAVSTTPRGA